MGVGSDNRDTPYYRGGKPVDVNVNVNVKDDRKPRCEHGNYAGECLLCERGNKPSVRKVGEVR
jgi:hypothetical protein